MVPLKDESPRSDVLFVFLDFLTTRDTKGSDLETLHVPNLVCLQQICTHCEMLTNIDEECQRCGKRNHSFWDDLVGDLSYLCETRPWVSNVMEARIDPQRV